jgi:hypothetical protein
MSTKLVIKLNLCTSLLFIVDARTERLHAARAAAGEVQPMRARRPTPGA